MGSWAGGRAKDWARDSRGSGVRLERRVMVGVSGGWEGKGVGDAISFWVGGIRRTVHPFCDGYLVPGWRKGRGGVSVAGESNTKEKLDSFGNPSS